MTEKQIFKVRNENGQITDAELLTTFGLEQTGKEYALYSIPSENEKFDIFASIIVKDVNGLGKLVDIEDTSEKQMILSIVENAL